MYKNILFFRLDSCLGDSIVHRFVLRELKKRFPSARLTVATSYPSNQFFAYAPYIDKLIVLPALGPADNPHRYLRPGVLWGLINMLVRSYVERYDLIILPHTVRTPLNNLYCKLLPHTLFPPYDYTQPITTAYTTLLKQLGATEIDTTYEFSLQPQHISYAHDFLQQHHLSANQFWVINPVGAASYKNLSLTQIQQLTSYLQQHGHPVVLLDYKNAFATSLPNMIRCTTADIFQTAAILAQAKGVISVDTGIVHLTDCFNKPMLVLYATDRTGPYARSFWAPKQNTTRYVQSTSSVATIAPAKIIDYLEQML